MTKSTRVFGTIVDAINICPKLQICFLDYHDQKKIARGFTKMQQVDFDDCVGYINEMIVWINKYNMETLEKYNFG